MVHSSVDYLNATYTNGAVGLDGYELEQAVDEEGCEREVMQDSRIAQPEDGLLSIQELQSLFADPITEQPLTRMHSAYGECNRLVTEQNGNYFGQQEEEKVAIDQMPRVDREIVRSGYFEVSLKTYIQAHVAQLIFVGAISHYTVRVASLA